VGHGVCLFHGWIRGVSNVGFARKLPTKMPLMAYGGRPLSVKGHCVVNVRVGDTQKKQLKLTVVNEEKGRNLFGLDWSDTFGFTARGMSQLDRHSADYQGKTDVLSSCYTQAIAQKRETSSDVKQDI